MKLKFNWLDENNEPQEPPEFLTMAEFFEANEEMAELERADIRCAMEDDAVFIGFGGVGCVYQLERVDG